MKTSSKKQRRLLCLCFITIFRIVLLQITKNIYLKISTQKIRQSSRFSRRKSEMSPTIAALPIPSRLICGICPLQQLRIFFVQPLNKPPKRHRFQLANFHSCTTQPAFRVRPISRLLQPASCHCTV